MNIPGRIWEEAFVGSQPAGNLQYFFSSWLTQEDLAFLTGNRLLILVEVQSIWSENILVRFLMYLGETYRRYIKMNGLKLYYEKNVKIPKPELYVVYTGDQEGRPETISLRECFFGGQDCCVDVIAKVIYDSKHGDILNQYITFSKVFDEQRKLYPGDRAKAIRETIRICREKDVLKEYLAREEAAAVMFSFADQVDAMQEALSTERSEGEARGDRLRMEKDAKGRFAAGLQPDAIAKIQEVSVDVIEGILGLQRV